MSSVPAIENPYILNTSSLTLTFPRKGPLNDSHTCRTWLFAKENITMTVYRISPSLNTMRRMWCDKWAKGFSLKITSFYPQTIITHFKVSGFLSRSNHKYNLNQWFPHCILWYPSNGQVHGAPAPLFIPTLLLFLLPPELEHVCMNSHRKAHLYHKEMSLLLISGQHGFNIGFYSTKYFLLKKVSES